MNNMFNLSLDDIRSKLHKIDTEIKQLQEERGHLQYIVNNFLDLSRPNPNQIPLFSEVSPKADHRPSIQFDSTKGTKYLIIDILKSQTKSMNWREIYAIFRQIKPEISVVTFRVSLSQVTTNPKFPVSRVGAEQYRYDEKKTVAR